MSDSGEEKLRSGVYVIRRFEQSPRVCVYGCPGLCTENCIAAGECVIFEPTLRAEFTVDWARGPLRGLLDSDRKCDCILSYIVCPISCPRVKLMDSDATGAK